MKAFQYVDARSLAEAGRALGRLGGQAQVIAGGSDLIQNMKDHVLEPEVVINIKNVAELRRIRRTEHGHEFGALVTLRDLAGNQTIRKQYAALAQAAGSVGTPQIRNVGTLGGNLCQRPRCFYYRDAHAHCLKKGGTRCFAAEDDGNSKYNAIFGYGSCYIVRPSDVAVALVALDATIHYGDGLGDKTVAAEDFFTMPKPNPQVENILRPDELVTAVFVPDSGPTVRSAFVKFKEKATADFARAAVAIQARLEGGVIQEARVCLGGVAPVPWRARGAEQALKGKKPTAQVANQAAAAALAGAKPLAQNGYKVHLTKVMLRRALHRLTPHSHHG